MSYFSFIQLIYSRAYYSGEMVISNSVNFKTWHGTLSSVSVKILIFSSIFYLNVPGVYTLIRVLTTVISSSKQRHNDLTPSHMSFLLKEIVLGSCLKSSPQKLCKFSAFQQCRSFQFPVPTNKSLDYSSRRLFRSLTILSSRLFRPPVLVQEFLQTLRIPFRLPFSFLTLVPFLSLSP